MQLAKYWRIKIQGCCWPRCRDTWKPFRWFRCSKRWSWLKAALFNFAMWGCGADLQSSVIWSYPRSTIPHSSTPSPARYGTRLFTASQYSLFSIFFHVYLVWCQVQNHGNESRDCYSQISREEIQNWIHWYTSSFTTYWWMVTQWASVQQQKVWPPPSPRRSKWRIPVQNCLIILLSSRGSAFQSIARRQNFTFLCFCSQCWHMTAAQ